MFKELLSNLFAPQDYVVKTASTSDWSWVNTYLARIGSIDGVPPELIANEDRKFDNNSVIMCCYNWGSRKITEPPIVLCEDHDTTETEIYTNEQAINILRRPNSLKWNEARLLQSWLMSLMFYGNSYTLKQRNPYTGFVNSLIWLPPWCVTPMGDGGSLAYYEYSPPGGGTPLRYAPNDIIHKAMGVDPQDTRLGLSPLRAVMKWALTDNEAALYTLAIMKNQGARTTMFSPMDEKARFTDPVVQLIQSAIQTQTTGKNRATALVMNSKVNAQEIGFSPEEAALDKMLRVPERKITAALGVPMIVAGLLDNPSYSNYGVADRVATEGFLLPYWKIIADALTYQLYPDTETYYKKPEAYYRFDLAKVRSLQEDEDKRHLRWDKDYYYGVAKRSEARRALGLKVTDEDDVYYHDILADMKTSSTTPSQSGSGGGTTDARREGLPLEDTQDDRQRQ